LPTGATIGGIYRREELLFVTSETVIESGDHIIVFLADKRHIPEVESLFQVRHSFV